MRKIVFGLGSNLGNRQENLEKAVNFLSKRLDLKNIKSSKALQNKALLKPNSPKEWNMDFLNIAISAKINLDIFTPQKILTIIKNIEKDLGRKDSEAWAPREIDIDILAIEDLIIDEKNLKIPHESLLKRDFFIKTFVEIEPDWQYPVKGDFFGKKICEF